jgi:hypothetical protein
VRSVVPRSLLAAAVLLLLLVPLAACGGSAPGAGDVVGSSAQVTKTYDYSGFTAVQADQKFSVNVQQGKSFAVSVTVNDNLVQYLQVKVQGDTLHIGLDPGKSYRLADLTAEVTMPDVTAVTVNGAADAFVKGFTSGKSLTFKVGGAGKLSVSGLKAEAASFDVSGGSDIGGDLELTGDLAVTASGAAQGFITGSGRNVTLVASGAAVISLKRFTAHDADVSLSGASQAGVRATGTIDVQASEASTFIYYGPAKLGKTDVNGASQVSHIQG